MSEKDVKMKPTPTPKTPSVKGNSKIKVKSKEAIVSTVKDAKTVMKDALVKKAVESKLGTDTQERQPQKADTEAAESVENAAYVTADTAYHKGKTYAQNKIKEHRAKVKTREETESINQPENQEINNSEPNTHIEDVKTPDNEPKVNDDQVKTSDNAPKTRESYNTNEQPLRNQKSSEHTYGKPQEKITVKTKEEYLKSQSETSSHGVKTKESYINKHKPEDGVKDVKGKEELKTTSSDSPITPKDARKEYVTRKLKTKAEYEKRQSYSKFLLESYEETYFPEKIRKAGKAAYVERNQEMIDKSDYCICYYDENYQPPIRKRSKKDIISYQPKSGTKIAYDYAVKKGISIINIFI